MDVSVMLDVIESYGFETDDEMTDDRKIEAINETYFDVCGREMWPFLEARDTAFLPEGGNGLVQIDATYAPRQIMKMWWSSGTFAGRVLAPARSDDIAEQFSTDASLITGSPTFYYFIGRTLYIAPVPPEPADNLTVLYLREPLPLTVDSLEADVLVPPRYHRSLLVNGTLARLYMAQEDVDLGAASERLYEKALALMVNDEFRRDTDRTEYIHVSDPDNWDYS